MVGARGEGSAAPVVGRPKGKSSSDEYKQYSVLLKKKSRKIAMRVLDDHRPLSHADMQDFSSLMQFLLDQWIVEQGVVL